MTTSWKLATALAAVLVLAITSSLATAYLMRPPVPANTDPSRALTGADVPPELDRMSEPRRGIVEYVRGVTGASDRGQERPLRRPSAPPRSRDAAD